MSQDNLEETIVACLRAISDPCSVATGYPLNLEEMGLVRSVNLDRAEGLVSIELRLTSPTCVMVSYFASEIRERVQTALPSIREVKVSFDRGFDWTPEMMSERVKNARELRFGLKRKS